MIQNQTGNYPRRWDKTGVVIKAKGFDQYQVMTHGSRKITLRNRKFLRKIDHPSQRFTYPSPDVIPSSPARPEHPQPLSQSGPPDLPRPITPTPVPLTPEPSSPNHEESFFTPQQSPSIRVNKQRFDELMDAARGSPAPALPPPVTSPASPSTVASPAPPPQSESQTQAPAPPELRISSRANKGKTSRYDDYIRSMNASYRNKLVLSIKSHPQNSKGRDITDIRPDV